MKGTRIRIAMIAAALPPQLDGIGDYTANLAAELAKSVCVTVLTGQEAHYCPIPGVAIEPTFSARHTRSVWRIAERAAADRPDWALLQYNPFSYGRWGLNLHLPLVMRALRKNLPGTRIAVMVHEPFVPVINARFAIMTTWQRWQLWMLGRNADVLFFSIEAWAKRFAQWFPGKPVSHLPVGSNIPRVPIPREEARSRLGIRDEAVVLGLFGTMHGSRLLDRVRGAAEAVCGTGREALLLYMGPQGPAVRRALGGIATITDGPLPPEEVSRRFAAVDVYLTPFIDGVSTRRTSLMTGLQHGVATVGTHGALTDTLLSEQNGCALLLADVNDPEGFNSHVLRLMEDKGFRQALGRAGQGLYENQFAWRRIAQRWFDAVGRCPHKQVQTP